MAIPELPRKNTHLLIVGTDPDEWRRSGMSGQIKGGLHSMDMGWGYVSNAVPNVDAAIAFLDQFAENNIVQVIELRAYEPTPDQVVVECVRLAERLKTYNNGMTWVTFDHGANMRILSQIFTERGIRVEGGFIEQVIDAQFGARFEAARQAGAR